MNIKKIGIIAGAIVLATIGGWLIAKKTSWIGGYHGKIIGELKVLTRSPEGPEIPISTDGITVMFNKAVVPLSTLDSGRDKSIPLKITPSVDGKFFWLGTHGFIFRPTEPLDPATKYHVEMPGGVVSVDGYRLNQAISWDFSTVSPAVLNFEPAENQNLLPKNASFFLRFNLMMNTADVEKKLAITDEATGQVLLMKRDYVWGDDGHTLRVQFKDELPWESKIKVTLPAGTMAKKGTVGTTEEVTTSYVTPAKKMVVEKVDANEISEGNPVTFQPNKETLIEMGSGVCYHFSQTIEKKSFQKAFQVDPRKQPYFYFGYQETNTVMLPDGALKDIDGYKDGCIAFLDDYAKTYKFSIKPDDIQSLSGAKLEGGGDPYIAKTRDSAPYLHSLLTKNILTANGPEGSLRIPYRGVNMKSLTVRLYRWTNKEQFTEAVKDDTLIPPDEKSKTPTMGSFGRNTTVPIDPATMTIDQVRMPAEATQEIPANSAPNTSSRFVVDLAAFPQKPGPGLYLVEAIGNPLPGRNAVASNGPRSVYSMVQITPVAVAVKREADHVLVWTTDIEKGTPLSGMPVRITLKKWNSAGGFDETVTEGNVITNEQGVGVLNLASTNELHACAEVTQPGSESYTCEADHRVSDYASVLGASPHYYAYVYTDRPIYRPGQKVYFSSFIREVREGRYFTPGAGADVAITDSSGQEVLKQDRTALQSGGVVSGEYEIPSDENTPRGDYNLRMTVGKQTFTRIFVVTSYRKPSFKVDLKTDKPEIVSGDEMKVDVKGSYFFGAPMRKAKTTWSIMTSTYIFAPEGYTDYSFLNDDLFRRKQSDEGEDEFSGDSDYNIVSSSSLQEDYTSTYAEDNGQYDDPRGAGTERGGGDFFKETGKDVVERPGALSDQGELAITYKPDLKKYPASQVLSVEANVEDPSHQQVSGGEDVVVHKADFYLGVKSEKWVYGAKETAKIQVVSLDTTGKPAAKKSFDVDVVRRNYKYIEKRTAQGYWSLVYETEDTKLKTLSGKTDDKGLGDVSFTFDKGGTYRFITKGKDGRNNEMQSATEVFAWGEDYVPWRLDKPETVELVPDKDSYKVGDTAKILVKSLVPVTKALMTLERGRVLEYKVIDLGGNASHIEVPVTEGMIPNLYVSVIAHVGRAPGDAAAAAHPPLLYTGETEIHVEPESKRLNVSITPDRTGEGETPPIYRPGDNVTVKIKTTDPTGKPQKANVIVSVADESVLRLLDYQLPDLVKKFYYRRPDGVVSSSSLISLKAGDSGQGGTKKRRIFKDTAHFEGHLATNDQGEASFSFTLPDDLTTWVIEALAVTDSKTSSQFESERQQAMPLRPAGQSAVGSDLVLTDNTFVGGNRGKIMTTVPLVLRTALPRFAVWGDEVVGQVIANNRNPQEVKGTIKVAVSGDAVLHGGNAADEIKFSLPANSEKAFPVDLSVVSATAGKLTFSAEAKDDKGVDLDSLEITLPVEDRYAPEVVASAGMTQAEEKEQVEIPPDIPSDKGGLDVTFKSSIGLAAAPSLRHLIYYPWGCSEQKSATLLALLMAKDLSQRFGESYFDALAPVPQDMIQQTKGLDAKLALLDKQINKITEELITKFQDYGGGIKYWPESLKPDYLASVQTLVGLTKAMEQGYTVDDAAREKIKTWLRTEIQNGTQGPDAEAFALWGLTLDHTSEYNLTEDLAKEQPSLSTTGLSHLLMAMKNQNWQEPHTEITGRLLSFAKQEPRHTSWPDDGYYGFHEKNTALAALALLTAESDTELHPMVPRALAFLLNQKKSGTDGMTQNALYLSWLVTDFTKRAQEDKTDFKATLTAEAQTLLEQSFNKASLLSVATKSVPVKDLAKLKQPIDLTFKKVGEGTLYYDMVLKYYLPPDKTPTREEGLIISREYYALDDVKEEKPLTEFKAGENYKGHITLVVPQEMNYVLVQDPIPAGFEPIDMALATTSRAAALQANSGGSDQEGQEEGDEGGGDDRFYGYDDVVTAEDYGTDYGFSHQEIRDDAIVWSDEILPPGVYHVRYPVRATTAGTYLMPGARAFEFYEPEIFGRSRMRTIEIKE